MYDENLKRILDSLKGNKQGLTLSEVASKIKVHRNSVAKYLDILITQGKLEVRNIGRAKLYTISNKLPYDQLINVTPTANVILDSQKRIIQMNEKAKELFGELINQNLEETKIKEVLEKSSFKKKLYETKIIPLTLENGNNGEVIIFDDITTKVEQEQQLKLLQRAVESSASGITIADMQKKDQPLIYINKAFEKITGYSKREVLGKNCRFLQGRDTDEKTKQEIRNTINQGKEGRFEILNYKKDKKKFWNELYLSPVKNQDGIITHYVGVQSDISYRKKLFLP